MLKMPEPEPDRADKIEASNQERRLSVDSLEDCFSDDVDGEFHVDGTMSRAFAMSLNAHHKGVESLSDSSEEPPYLLETIEEENSDDLLSCRSGTASSPTSSLDSPTELIPCELASPINNAGNSAYGHIPASATSHETRSKANLQDEAVANITANKRVDCTSPVAYVCHQTSLSEQDSCGSLLEITTTKNDDFLCDYKNGYSPSDSQKGRLQDALDDYLSTNYDSSESNLTSRYATLGPKPPNYATSSIMPFTEDRVQQFKLIRPL